MTGTPHNPTTSLSLLSRLRRDPDDVQSWEEFVARYGSVIQRWCLQWGLQEADALDVKQNVLLALSKQMKTFEYRADGRFRSWLKTIAHRSWMHFLDRRRRDGVSGGDDIDRMLQSAEARDHFLDELDRECERNMLEDAMNLVQQRVQPATWQAFRRTAIENEPGASVAADLDMTIMAVYRAKSRVQSMIQEEIELIEGPQA